MIAKTIRLEKCLIVQCKLQNKMNKEKIMFGQIYLILEQFDNGMLTEEELCGALDEHESFHLFLESAESDIRDDWHRIATSSLAKAG